QTVQCCSLRASQPPNSFPSLTWSALIRAQEAPFACVHTRIRQEVLLRVHHRFALGSPIVGKSCDGTFVVKRMRSFAAVGIPKLHVDTIKVPVSCSSNTRI